MTHALLENPTRADGTPMLVATNEQEFQAYLEWLATYLYRPDAAVTSLSGPDEASLALGRLEDEIVEAVWNDNFSEHPLGPPDPLYDDTHLDMRYRPRISGILSAVPDHATRVSLLERFYVNVYYDSRK